ncbi:MAG: TonB-dependent receptor [Bacteroidia bacterium]|nr:TonB-dependent receptor [Bacteroidia bacterium]
MIPTLRFILVFSGLFLITSFPSGQTEMATVQGRVFDVDSDEPISIVTIYVEGTSNVTESDEDGRFSIKVRTGVELQLNITRIGYKSAIIKVPALDANQFITYEIGLSLESSGLEIIVTGSQIEQAGMIREGVEALKLIPTTSGNFESILPHIALGTSGGTGGELSSQYNVRGGNYDENLVYVNDFEIYRPQLIRAGQQEGLSFPNIDLIKDLTFSSGGFESKYGDKLSSVLDIKYKRPDAFAASAAMSFLGGSAHLEGSWKPKDDSYRKLRFLTGVRYKTTEYLLGSLDTKGEYTPNFMDVQGYLTYDLNRDWQVGLLGNYNRAEYKFQPTERNTGIGLIDFALQLRTFFEGQERDDFTNAMGGLSLTYLPEKEKNPLFLKFLASTYQSQENERFDILGFYNLAQVESDLGSSDYGEVIGILGTGTQHQYVRNYLQMNVTNAEFKGGIEYVKDTGTPNAEKSNFIQWSIKWQNEDIDDRINEWERLDSAGYSLPYDPNSVQILRKLKSNNLLQSNRFSGYVQNTFFSKISDQHEIKLSAGVRAAYWDLNEELIISPRAQLLYKPLAGRKNVSYRLSAGFYHQPPFYRELRRPDGSINPDLQSQKSFHLVGGMTLDFQAGKENPTKFKLITEAYYKKLWDLTSYDIDNVRIRYSGENDSEGYVAGLDIRVNGEFVPGAESWVNLSLLQAKERIKGVEHLEREEGQTEGTPVDYVSRPTDQFLTLSMFFQDYLPKNENIKMNLNFTVGTGLPFGLPENNTVYRNTYRFSPYHRVDIGFGFQLWNREWSGKRPNHFLKFTKSTWASLEVFNLMKVENEASNTWVKTVFNTQYAIPNNLTSRRINLRFRFDL